MYYVIPPDISITIKDGKKAIFKNIKKGKEWTFTKKPVVQIANILNLNDRISLSSSKISEKTNIGETDVIGHIKVLIKKGLVSNKDDVFLYE